MNKGSSKKSIIIIVVIVVIAALVYFYYQGSNGSNTSSTLTISQTNTASSGAVGAQVLTLLNQIRSLRIDSTLFTDPGYQTLRDYSVTIPPENVGRANPFAPLPGAQTTTGSTAGH